MAMPMNHGATKMDNMKMDNTTGTLKQGQLAMCVYARGAAKLQVEVTPKAYGSGGYGGPPGMVVSKPAGFGPGARFIKDTNPKHAFSTLSLIKGAYWGDIWANGKIPSARVLALARVLYARL